jgi:primosomal protein N' (replication factor Y) (superfamily II helicase)
MSAFCDVAMPVPLDQAFTYAVPLGMMPVVGGRVLVPFRREQMSGVVVRLHETPPPVEAKPLLSVMDAEPLVSLELMELAQWIAAYYVAPIGEVLRAMLPLTNEVRRENHYRITGYGQTVLQQGADIGASRRSRLSAEDQQQEYTVLNALSQEETLSARSISSATGARRPLLDGMVRKKWIIREQQATARPEGRKHKVAVLVDGARLPKLNAPQQALLAELAAAGGRLQVAALRERGLSESSLQTLVRHGAVQLEEQETVFHMSGLSARNAAAVNLTEEQTEALAHIVAAMDAAKFSTTLLYGVTGSGKTAVYLAAMQHAVARGKSVLLLVPEIGLTPAMAAELYAGFGDAAALLHSALTPSERAEQWRRIQTGEARVVVGTRSAVFAPVEGLGLIIVDEEHDASYKQEENPRYHGRDVAVMRGSLAGVPVVLGSATPSLESWRNAERGKYQRVVLSQRVAERPMPEVERIDMRVEFQETGEERVFSRRLLAEIGETLERGEQALVLLNRRGYSFVVLCRACGERLECVNCAIALTFHKAPDSIEDQPAAGHRLECHYCGYRRTVPRLCPKCNSEYLYFFGAGSQQGEEKLLELFPNARIGRMDRDTVRGRHDLERLLTRLHSGEINLLVGTQMIAKGHDIHGVTLVGVVGADHALSMPDFRAAERVFQLLTQVGGRAGRGDLPGRVVVQTYYPEHYAIQYAAQHDFEKFAAREMHFRKHLFYPPFTALANVLVRGKKLEEVAGWVATLGRWFERQRAERAMGDVRVLGPAASPIARIKGVYRFHFLLKAQRREALSKLLREMLAHAAHEGIPRQQIVVDVDAVSLM